MVEGTFALNLIFKKSKSGSDKDDDFLKTVCGI